MTFLSKLLRRLLPASMLSLSGCVLLLFLLPASIVDVLFQVGCEQCFGDSPVAMLVANGVEGREQRPSESPGLPPTEEIDQEPEEPAYLAELGLTCDELFALADFFGATAPRPSQSAPGIRSGGFAVVIPGGAAGRYRGGADAAGPLAVAYMTNSVDDTVAAIDPATRAVLSTVRVGDRPRGIAATPDGTRLFVANEESGSVSVIEAATLTEVTRIALPGDAEPYDVAITPDGAEAWVTGHEASGFVHILDTSLLTVAQSVRVGRMPVQVAISPDGTLAYVTNEGDNRLSVLDVWTRSVQRSLTVPSPFAVAFDPTGARVYVSSRSSPGAVRMIDVASDATLATWEVGEKPEYLRLDPFATRLFVTNRLSPFISVINLLSGEAEAPIAAPRGLGPMASIPAS